MKNVLNRFSSLVCGAALGVTLCLSCASTPTSDIRVHSAVDAKSNIAGYKSYAWDTKRRDAARPNRRCGYRKTWIPRPRCSS